MLESKVWVNDHWLKFRLIIGIYQNIIIFLDFHELSFFKTLEIDFTSVPLSLHGNGNSLNLLEYLANNVENDLLISQFIMYFLSTILNIRYYLSDENIVFFMENIKWQNMNIYVCNPDIVINNYVETDYIDNYFE